MASGKASDFLQVDLVEMYATRAINDNNMILERGLGVVRFGQLGAGTEFDVMPYFQDIASLVSRRDVAADTTPVATLKLTGGSDKGVVLRRKVGPVRMEDDDIVLERPVTKAQLSAALGAKFAAAWPVQMKTDLYKATVSALAGGCPTHVVDVTEETDCGLSYATLLQARQAMGDAFQKLTTLVCHSAAFAELQLDAMSYVVSNVLGTAIVTGLPPQLGLSRIIVDDHMLTVDAEGYTDYHNLLLGDQALYIAFQRALTVEMDRSITAESPATIIRGDLDYMVHVPGIKWNSATTNPNDGALTTSGNWAAAHDDHRSVAAVDLLTKIAD